MTSSQLRTLKFFALLFLLPGLAGLIVAAMVSTHYASSLPQWPTPEQNRIIPRSISGITVYQTPQEDRTLTVMEYGSVGIFSIGLILGLTYLEKWGSRQAELADEEPPLPNHAR